MALPFFPLYLTRELGFSVGQAGGLMALYGIVALLVAPAAGRLCDRWGTDHLMIGSLALSGLAMAAFPLARSLTAVAVMTVLWAISSEAFRPANMTAVAAGAPPEMRKQAYALHRLAINLGMSAGPAAGGFLAAVSFKWLWLADAATSLLAALVLALWLEKPGRAETSEAELPSPAALSDPRLRWALLASVLVAIVFFQHDGALALDLVRGHGYSESFYGLLFTLNTLMIVAFEVPLNHAMARWSHARSLTLGAALFAVGFGAYGLPGGTWMIVAATAIWTVGEMVLMPAMSAYVTEISSEKRRGEYMGLYMMSFSLAFVIGPWAGLLILENCGARALWASCLALGAISTLMYSRVR